MKPNTENTRSEEYTKPQIADYGDVTELTAGLSTGSRVDATLKIGQPATFLSGP